MGAPIVEVAGPSPAIPYSTAPLQALMLEERGALGVCRPPRRSAGDPLQAVIPGAGRRAGDIAGRSSSSSAGFKANPPGTANN